MLRSFDSLPPHPHRAQKERGQAIVIIALAMIALLAFTGLAIDGGGLIALHRDAVNATDAAVLASSYAICVRENPTEDTPVEAALDAAKKNGFDNNRTTNWVNVTYPAIVDGVANPDYVEIQIIADKPAYFIQVVRQEPLRVDTRAVGFCQQKFETSMVSGVFGISQCDCNPAPVSFSASQIDIYGGTYANGCTASSSGQNNYAIYGGSVSSAGGTSSSTEFTFYPLPPATTTGSIDTSIEPIGNPLADIKMDYFKPGGEIYEAVSIKTYVHSGNMPAGWRFQAGAFQPSGELRGLYYVEGALTIGNNDNVTWHSDGATIIATGAINIDTNVGVRQKFYSELLTLGDAISVPTAGFLYFTTYGQGDYENAPAANCQSNQANNAIQFSGTNNTTGVVYAPHGGININFPNNNQDPNRCGINHTGPLVGWLVDLSGSRGCIYEDPSLIPPMPPRVNIAH